METSLGKGLNVFKNSFFEDTFPSSSTIYHPLSRYLLHITESTGNASANFCSRLMISFATFALSVCAKPCCTNNTTKIQAEINLRISISFRVGCLLKVVQIDDIF